jgi:SAM-dependent methyltransferase
VARRLVAAAGLATIAVAYWARRHPSACPYAARVMVQVPHPGISRRRLIEALAPAPGERVLEIGPGTGHYSLEVASRLQDGTLAIFDLQQDFLDHTLRAGGKRGLTNIEPSLGDARSLPYEDGSFDAVYLVTVLGEIPGEDAALQEMHRVLAPSGRMVVGETALGDPHFVSLGALRPRAERAGLSFERRHGSPVAYFARFRK